MAGRSVDASVRAMRPWERNGVAWDGRGPRIPTKAGELERHSGKSVLSAGCGLGSARTRINHNNPMADVVAVPTLTPLTRGLQSVTHDLATEWRKQHQVDHAVARGPRARAREQVGMAHHFLGSQSPSRPPWSDQQIGVRRPPLPQGESKKTGFLATGSNTALSLIDKCN